MLVGSLLIFARFTCIGKLFIFFMSADQIRSRRRIPALSNACISIIYYEVLVSEMLVFPVVFTRH